MDAGIFDRKFGAERRSHGSAKAGKGHSEHPGTWSRLKEALPFSLLSGCAPTAQWERRRFELSGPLRDIGEIERKRRRRKLHF
jgi:hypothetical protein